MKVIKKEMHFAKTVTKETAPDFHEGMSRGPGFNGAFSGELTVMTSMINSLFYLRNGGPGSRTLCF